MKVRDILNEKQLYTPNQSDKTAKEIEYPNVYTSKNAGKGKLRREKVVVRDSNTGKVYGMRTVVQHR